MYKSSDVADRLRDMAKLRGVTMKAVLEDCDLNFNMMTMMRTSMPKADTIAKLADRLECSVDYLLGRTSEMLTPGAMQSPAQTSAQAQNISEMLALYVQLSERDQVLLIGRLQNMVEQQGGGGEASPHTPTSSGSSPAKAV